MKLVDRYIITNVVAAIGLVTLVLAGLQIFILFVNQLDDIGRADFGLSKVALYVLLQMPYQVYLFFPMASLLGCLIGLGVMANNRELVILRASGMSIAQITFALMKAALLLIAFVTILGETVVPELTRYATDLRIQALTGGQALRTAHGVWWRYHNDFILAGTVSSTKLTDVSQFRFDDQHHLQLTRKIALIYPEDGIWYARDVAQTELSSHETKASHRTKMIWDVRIKPDILSMSASEPDEMSLHELALYLREQKNIKLSAPSYQLAFWQRIVQPLTTMVMMILAIPFIFGPLRSTTMGSKLLMGATVGFGFHILNRFVGPVSQVLQGPPIVAALAPTLLFSVLGIYLMRRMR